MNYERRMRGVEKANRILKDELGCAVGSNAANLIWIFSEDLEHVDNVLDESGKPIMDNHCTCGVNVAVHAPECKFTTPKMRLAKKRMMPWIKHKWLLCRWELPDRGAWVGIYGTLDNYPEKGRYIPLSLNGLLVQLPEQSPPSDDDSWLIVHSIKSDPESNLSIRLSRWQNEMELAKAGRREALEAQARKERAEEKKSEEWAYVLRDAMPAFGNLPGRKCNASFPTAVKP